MSVTAAEAGWWRSIAAIFGTARVTGEGARHRRVVFLVACLIAMGLVDLAFTLTYLTTVGMYELNPIARFLIANGTTWHLITYKLVTISISSIAIFAARRARLAELAAWSCAAMLCMLMVHWLNYTATMDAMTQDIAILLCHQDEVGGRWLRLEH